MNDRSNSIVALSGSDYSVSVQKEFVSEWEKTENALRSLEKFHGILSVPALMGLREFGRHFASALSMVNDGATDEALAEIGKSIDELRRARHDAIRTLVEFCHFELLLIEKSYPSDQIYQVCREYFDISEEMGEVNSRINSDFLSMDEADEYYSSIEKGYVPRLLEVYSQMNTAKSAALDAIKQNSAREEKYKKLAVAGFGVGLVGLLIGIATIFL